MISIESWIVIACTIVAVVLCVVLHYEGLRFMSNKIQPRCGTERRMIVVMILWLVLLHITEIWIFGLTYYAFFTLGDFGYFAGAPVSSVFDCVYFSAAVFTTLGFGDIVPVGPIRFITGTEAVSGLTLITWSASYTFLEMMKTWKPERD